MHPIRLIPAVVLALAASACTWVPLQGAAAAVRVLPANAATTGCTQLGEIEVNVTDRVAFFDRNPLRVREELESMARNEAVGLGATAVRPVAPPADGRQRFTAWRCPR